MNANTAIRTTTAFCVGAVAVIAAIISFSHIRYVALSHGQTHLDSNLLPFSVDGLIAAASLVLFYASRNRLPAPGLARAMLALGVGATIAVNGIYGIRGGILGILLSAWPAGAFIGAAELTIWMVRAAVAVGSANRYSKANEIRQFARMKGFNVADRGRIPQDIIDAFNLEHANGNGAHDLCSRCRWTRDLVCDTGNQ